MYLMIRKNIVIHAMDNRLWLHAQSYFCSFVIIILFYVFVTTHSTIIEKSSV